MFYQVNHHAFMARAKAVLKYREMGGKGHIGASFAYTPSYALDCRPENAMAKCNYDDLKNYWWMDVYAYGRYPKAAMAYLKEQGIAPRMQPGGRVRPEARGSGNHLHGGELLPELCV